MNFTCDNCQKRYSIADEKVRGKTVKVRCKNCQNVITVEGPAEEESTRVVSLADVERLRAQERSLADPSVSVPAPVASAPPVAKAPPAALQTPWDDEPTRAAPLRATGSPWFVMVKNKQEGPLDEGALRELIATGTISGRSFFWQQGMADWKRGADVPELAGLFVPPPAPEPPPPPPPPPVAEPPARAAAKPAPARREPEPQHPVFSEPEPQFPQEPEPQAFQQPEPEEPQSARQWVPEEDPDTTYFGEPDPRNQPQPVGRKGAAPAATAAPLNELFSDLDLPEKGGEQDEAQGGNPYDDSQGEEGGEETQAPAKRDPRENTRQVAKKAGVTRRNSPMKYVAVVLLVLLLPLVVAYVLSEALGVMPLKVTTVDAQGQAVEQSVFTGAGVGALRDKLLGNTPPPVAPIPKAPPQAAPVPTEPKAAEPKAAEPTPGAEGAAAAPTQEQVQAVYNDAEKKDVAPEVREGAEVAAADSEDVGGPSDEEVERVVEQAQTSFRDCVEQELKRNPSYKGGKATLTATVGTSGAVKEAKFDRKELNANANAVGSCIRERARRMTFSSFSGEDIELEIPLVLSGR
ncbi:MULTISPECIES: AgmX/PglI C-terminal domain-containing protein [unclassified Myxococcus]|uniref:AgmX/PglI C-terminal domain-containing protein n=1 Tax=unclassified Myxococcus TaxID=2648731 RepID=UPI001CBA988E|nr:MULTISPECIES: AgmX/PglI C-terminal domain-containing protein [unclassified Myxococcus]MBZ4394666.1 zinc-ribbon domain-containing protein [Myxococcus sp. AS-1-15]MBZ4410138.1 zinc-ribbon domain-containing protein [Myxococcus sp. XM-1-1-1]